MSEKMSVPRQSNFPDQTQKVEMTVEEANTRRGFEAYLSERHPEEAAAILAAADSGLEELLRGAGELRAGERLHSVTDRERVERWRELMRSEESWLEADPDRTLSWALTLYARFVERLDLAREKSGLKPARPPHQQQKKKGKERNKYVVEVGEIAEGEVPGVDLAEGEASEVTLTRYERNPKLRRLCIESYGGSARCEICGFDFEEHYGPREGGKYIEVHHVLGHAERSRRAGRHTVDCHRDLIPLCANCHRMIHLLGRETLSPAQLKRIWEDRHGNQG